MVTVWVDKKSGKIVLKWNCYAEFDRTNTLGIKTMTIATYEFVGIALENEHGVTCVFTYFDMEKDFEYIGEL